MCLIGLYLDTKYEVCRWNNLLDMTISLVFLPIFWKIWPWPWVKVFGTWVIKCALLGCTLLPSMKSVGEIASEIWPVLWYFTHFGENLTLTLIKGQGHRHLGHWMRLIGLYLGTKYEVCSEIASEIWPVLWFFTHFGVNLTLTYDLRSRSSALGPLTEPYWVVPWYQVWSL